MLELAPPAWPAAAVVVVVALGCVVGLRRRTRGREVWRYDPVAAWWRGMAYVAAGAAVGCASGAVPTILTNPLVLPGQTSSPLWWVVTAAVLGVVLVGYGVVWPRGTRPHGRRVVWPDTLLFGLLWGLGEGLLMASVWVLATRAWRAVLGAGGLTDGLVVATVVVVLSAWIGAWHALYWDVHVSPEHNVIERNGAKVALVHTPNVVLSTCWLTAWEDLGLFVLVQTLALTLSALAMPFPSPRRPLPPDPDGPVLGPPTRALRDLSGAVLVVVGDGPRASACAEALAPLGAEVVTAPSLPVDRLAGTRPVAGIVLADDGDGRLLTTVVGTWRPRWTEGARAVVLTSSAQYRDDAVARRVGLVRAAAATVAEPVVLALTPSRRLGDDLRYAVASPELDAASGAHLAGRRPQQPALVSLDEEAVQRWWQEAVSASASA